MGIIAWIVFGLIAGVIAKLLMPGRDGGGFILTCILGIVGAVVGDDVWYWRQYQRLQSAQFPGRRGGRDRGAGDFPPSATRLTAAKRVSVDPVSAGSTYYKHALLRRCRRRFCRRCA